MLKFQLCAPPFGENQHYTKCLFSTFDFLKCFLKTCLLTILINSEVFNQMSSICFSIQGNTLAYKLENYLLETIINIIGEIGETEGKKMFRYANKNRLSMLLSGLKILREFSYPVCAENRLSC